MFSEERGVLGAVCEGKGEISFIFLIFFVRGKDLGSVRERMGFCGV